MSRQKISNKGNLKTIFDITFDQSVTITKYFYPDFSFVDFFSGVGGSLGLWLGLGIMQLLEYGVHILYFVQKSSY